MPLGTGAACGVACHTIVKAKDDVFTAYPSFLTLRGLLFPRELTRASLSFR
jgi:hypothetical protein